MYQPCTSAAVNSGEQRAVTVTQKSAVISPSLSVRRTLITRRSQVQILPPPPIGPGHGTCPDQGRFASGWSSTVTSTG